MYYDARYYDPDLGRFLQADTYLDGMNRYTYCGNNPVRYVDPTGNDFEIPNGNGETITVESIYDENGDLDYIDAGEGEGITVTAEPITDDGGSGETAHERHLRLQEERRERSRERREREAAAAETTENNKPEPPKPPQVATGNTPIANSWETLNPWDVRSPNYVERGLEPDMSLFYILSGTKIAGNLFSLYNSLKLQKPPTGVPRNWLEKPSKIGGGRRFIDPANPHNSVRVMPGDSKSPFPNSRNPYVRWIRNGQSLDINGNVVAKNTPDAHIPLSIFKYF